MKITWKSIKDNRFKLQVVKFNENCFTFQYRMIVSIKLKFTIQCTMSASKIGGWIWTMAVNCQNVQVQCEITWRSSRWACAAPARPRRCAAIAARSAGARAPSPRLWSGKNTLRSHSSHPSRRAAPPDRTPSTFDRQVMTHNVNRLHCHSKLT